MAKADKVIPEEKPEVNPVEKKAEEKPAEKKIERSTADVTKNGVTIAYPKDEAERLVKQEGWKYV